MSDHETSNAERRQTPRVVLRTAVNLSSESNFYAGLSDNISEGGIFVATHTVMPCGTAMTVEFSLPDGGSPISTACEVTWVREYDKHSSLHPGMGCRFINLPESVRKRIETFSAKRETLLYEA